jgi:hypothetical protein
MIQCDVCGSRESTVTDTRRTRNTIRRKRRCDGCGERWTTYEVSSAFVSFALEVAQIARPLMEAAQAIGVAADDYEVGRYANAGSMGNKAAGKKRKWTSAKREPSL